MSFEVSIPSRLLLDKKIDPSCIKIFAFIKSLTRAHGYCYASNKYLAQSMGTCERSVQRYLKVLADEGYIEIIFDVTKLQTQRKIYLGTKLDKKGGVDKSVTPPSQACHTPTTDLSYINKSNIRVIEEEIEKEIYKEKDPSPPKIPEKEEMKFGEYVHLPKEDYETFCSKRGKDKVDDMVESINDYILSHGAKPYKDYSATLRAWFKKDDKQSKVISNFKPLNIKDKKQRDKDGNDLNSALDSVF